MIVFGLNFVGNNCNEEADMDNLIKFLDVVGAFLTVLSLYLIPRSYKYWILYTFACIPFTIVCLSRNLPGLTVMGVILFVIGVKNYLIGRKNERKG